MNTARLKMKTPGSFDGKISTAFNPWWKSVVMYLGFYPETVDRQKIAWIGTLLEGTAQDWHLHRYDTLGDADTWVNYSAAIRAEYFDAREAADAQLRLGQLKYEGSIRAYFTDFRALNNYARATGEGLREKVDLAMPSNILKMRFSHYLGEFATDEHFLEATYQAGLQAERLRALENQGGVLRPVRRRVPEKKTARALRKETLARLQKTRERKSPRPTRPGKGDGCRERDTAKKDAGDLRPKP